MRPTPTPGSSRDRALGSLLGLACGDAVGTTLEFHTPGTFEPISDMVGGGPFHLEPGMWTDDTAMALCMAESILDTGGCDLADQMRRYQLWKDRGYMSPTGTCFDIGFTTRAQIERFERTGSAVDPSPDPESAANGSLMRLAPIPIRWHTDLDRAVIEGAASSSTTHGARRPVDACRLYSAMVAAAVAGAPLDVVLAPDFWRWGPLDPEVEEIARGSYRRRQPPQIVGSGYCVRALEAALWAVAGADDFADAILRAANLGNDADTTAAIAGQLAGAVWGRSGIPAPWLERLAWSERIESLADALFRDATGTALPSQWPFDEEVHAWWVSVGAVLAGEYPGSPATPASPVDLQDTRTRLDLLVDNGIRTFVDLTHPDDRLPGYGDVLASVGRARAVELSRVATPIPDLGTLDGHGYDAILSTISDRSAQGGVFLHCWGGVGRTGTVVGALLIDRGVHNIAEVLSVIAALRAGTCKGDRPSPETPAQTAVLERRIAAQG